MPRVPLLLEVATYPERRLGRQLTRAADKPNLLAVTQILRDSRQAG